MTAPGAPSARDAAPAGDAAAPALDAAAPARDAAAPALDAAAPARDAAAPALDAAGISKTFGAVRVLHDVGLTLARGEIRALVGRNGCGKSTLIKVLAGVHAPDAGGRLALAGRPVALPVRAADLRAHGLAFVHQDLALEEEAPVIDNLLVGRWATAGGGRIPWRRERRRATEALARFGVEVDVRRPLRELSQLERALVAIVRALLELPDDGGVLVLDEPSAFLPAEDVERLFAAVRTAAAGGTAVVYVSHRLEEVLALADSVTVLRDGRHVVTRPLAGAPAPDAPAPGTPAPDAPARDASAHALTKDALVELILGQRLEAFYPSLAAPAAAGAPVLRAEGLRGRVVRDLSLTVGAGEIVGVTGLAGSGFDELPYLLFGSGGARGGIVTIAGAHAQNRGAAGANRGATGANRGATGANRGADVRIEATALDPSRAVAAGVALLPADRGRQSGVPELSVAANVSLPALGRFARVGRIDRRAERHAVRELIARVGVVPPDERLQLGQLSGGNQQKALLAKWLQLDPRVLLLHEPAQGVDVAAKHELMARIEQAAERGAGVLIASAEGEDLAHLCHRVLVLHGGRLVAELRGDEVSEERIAELSFGHIYEKEAAHV
ncbi:sugar ABC transporter ATP-binding protein [Conexibacter sp. CPCC 205706]|uniref:sugar ABC transporter ATP-binding protein n=1 Tax=unclassified Conexibacter TaxID=2627773 RepID=UPI00271E5B84|nr:MULTISPECIES: sugar ABC transporter ATP-binding protein [unclassified Conexibacter]MDO8186529.1 sugar ABC transporter ATP-binding protein [Conexibacter sp. CPCC 205706]MDO8200098.1 sugar ABC transporter ATP-binding protein [Conexibacter sp. CPCC 205762]